MIIVNNLSHSFGEKTLFSNFSFELPNGLYALVGKSGSGKTTLLRILAGLQKAKSGEYSIDSPISISFQENRLFPWYTALKNIEIVSDKNKARKILCELMMEDSFNKYPHELSGGMKRRVSLARALAAPSKTVLLDEPFAGLDEETAEKTLSVIRNYANERVILISTHNLKIAQKLDGTVSIDPSN